MPKNPDLPSKGICMTSLRRMGPIKNPRKSGRTNRSNLQAKNQNEYIWGSQGRTDLEEKRKINSKEEKERSNNHTFSKQKK